MEERQTNYTIAESYRLPSGGSIYSRPVNPIVELRSMTAREEMKRNNPSMTPLKVLADIIEGCMLEKPAIHVYDMAIGDYEYLLHKLRVVTYGDEYNMGIVCPYCGEQIDAKVHLDELEVKEFDKNKFDSLRTFTLPKSQSVVSIRFQTPRMLDDIRMKAKDLKRTMKAADLDFETFALLQYIIETVDGNLMNSFEIETFINRLPAIDLLKITQNLDNLNKCIGLNTEFYKTCPNCNSDVKAFFRFGPEFFRPTID